MVRLVSTVRIDAVDALCGMVVGSRVHRDFASLLEVLLLGGGSQQGLWILELTNSVAGSEVSHVGSSNGMPSRVGAGELVLQRRCQTEGDGVARVGNYGRSLIGGCLESALSAVNVDKLLSHVTKELMSLGRKANCLLGASKCARMARPALLKKESHVFMSATEAQAHGIVDLVAVENSGDFS
ncbi:hypothetical protein NE237_024091 [Protea cynaroides]|uniref:Uncharacterized protein n=1 Tax=Protea cynaroides TaxID=273540 RepID=A0A9Q0HHG1_9MAGN|nr:hypothetical protein NE237_024091 [Protea cynaroides]